jgi:7,8-dihydro-6-hydroxymethylpterin dimethyltransferase
MTNGTLFKGARLDTLTALAAEGRAPGRLRVQISLDGSTPEINDPIRGKGSFARIVEGIRTAVEAGLRPTVTATILRHNIDDLGGIVRLAASLGVTNVHLLWPHRRGRVLDGPFADLPSAADILTAVRGRAGRGAGGRVSIDNLEEFRLRLDGTPA